MATSVEELLRDAQHAYRNISPGSTDEKKYAANAKRLALRIIRKSPNSIEGTQARQILYGLGSDATLTKPKNLSHEPHPSQPRDVTHSTHAVAPVDPQSGGDERPTEDSWANIWQLFSTLSDGKKKVLVVALIFAVLFIGFTPFLLFFFVFYAFQAGAIKKHIRQLLTALQSG